MNVCFGMTMMRWFPVSCAVVALTASLFAGEVVPLTTLKEKYSVGKTKVDRSAFVAYTNAINTFMQQFKSKGDLESFLVLQNEQKALKDMPIIPTGKPREELERKIPAYRDMMIRIEADRTSQLTGLQKQYCVRLDALLKELMATDRIEEAKLVKEEKDSLVLLAKDQTVKEDVHAGEELVSEPAPATPPAGPEPAQKTVATPVPPQTAGGKPAKELIIIKASLIGNQPPVDITALLQERVVDGKLQVSDFSFVPRAYPGYYYYGEYYKSLMIQYKYKGGLMKNIRKKFGEAISISE